MEKKIKKRKRRIISPTKQKVLLLLLSGLVIGLSHSPTAPKRVFCALKKDWREINRSYLYRIIKEFHQERLVEYAERDDGTINIVITEAGREKALSFKIDSLKIKKSPIWDKKWRLVSFDIPEYLSNVRATLREKLQELGFKQLHKSVFIFPYPCEDEINFLVEFFNLRSYIRYAEVTKLTNEAELKLNFELF